MHGVLWCKKCERQENYSGDFRRRIVDNGGGYGRVKLIGNCPHCKFEYAVLFHCYSLGEQYDVMYIEDYKIHRYEDIMDDYRG